MKQLAKLCATNESKLKKDFKTHYGVTIYEMILNQKMKIAKELLKNKEISINEASNLVGYKNTSLFSRAFKESFGSSPMEHRKIYL
ncbi:helix-turn-helix domain-containing protein [Campylobacter ureolyticus]|uniref:helix-turn-helix domain-containing protein n=1 Tax=Campylobacter ureolyticus TaxID=827 RepID=UPI00290E1CD9|nr:helix-turn-helix transcriptional regulator [Campylobacter ureolyticus]MDU5326429.1 helix-turn-helix transcriptional regulator [Campylobacter ureolyticus]